MIFIYTLIAIFISWIWVDYFRLIDIYNKENLKYFILTFLLGALSTLLVFGINIFFFEKINFDLHGNLLNDVLYCFFGIGLVEELAKFIPFLLVYRLFKTQFNEPIDYIVFISISALGFSAAENVLYFHQYGAQVIDGRAILATVGHMFDTSLIAYGIIHYKYYDKTATYKGLWKYMLLAALSHAFYDFWLLFEDVKSFGGIITILYFFVTISLFSIILNNALNYSSFFTYKKMINSDKVSKRLFIYYAIVFLAQFILLVIAKDTLFALQNLRGSLYLSGFVIGVSVIRLSRFKLIHNRWENLRFEFPFRVGYGLGSGISIFGLNVKVKGEAFNETFVNAYYEEFCYLSPLSRTSAYLVKARLIFIEKKVFLKHLESFYIAKIYHSNNEDSTFDLVLLKPKTDRTTKFNEQNPIVAVLKLKDIADSENTELSVKDFAFKEWAIIKPRATKNVSPDKGA